MTHIHKTLPSQGTAIGIAFSGGLDTRTAVAWLARQGLKVHAYTADLAQPDEKDCCAVPGIALEHGAAKARLLDCKTALAREGLVALRCGAFHLSSGGKKYFNTTPLGRVATATAIVNAMKEDGVHVFSDGSTHKGNDIQRFFRYGLLADPELMIYKPWLDQTFVDAFGGRAEMSRYLASIHLPHTSEEKAYSTDANMLGATHEAKDLEHLDVSMRIVRPLMGHAPWSSVAASEKVTVTWDAGVPIAINDNPLPMVELFLEANKVGGRHGLGMSDQIENRVIEAKSRGIYEAPGMALLHLTYERLLSAVHNENTIDGYASHGRRLRRLLYEGRWLDAEAHALKCGLLPLSKAITGRVSVELRNGDDYTLLATEAKHATYAPEKLSMEKVASAFTPLDRIGALEMQALSIEDNRALMQVMK